MTEAVVRQDDLYKLGRISSLSVCTHSVEPSSSSDSADLGFALFAASSEDVRAQLKDERLQDLIKRIDSAPDREKVSSHYTFAPFL